MAEVLGLGVQVSFPKRPQGQARPNFQKNRLADFGLFWGMSMTLVDVRSGESWQVTRPASWDDMAALYESIAAQVWQSPEEPVTASGVLYELDRFWGREGQPLALKFTALSDQLLAKCVLTLDSVSAVSREALGYHGLTELAGLPPEVPVLAYQGSQLGEGAAKWTPLEGSVLALGFALLDRLRNRGELEPAEA